MSIEEKIQIELTEIDLKLIEIERSRTNEVRRV